MLIDKLSGFFLTASIENKN